MATSDPRIEYAIKRRVAVLSLLAKARLQRELQAHAEAARLAGASVTQVVADVAVYLPSANSVGTDDRITSPR